MALTSPGVQVTVIDESFYTPAEPGTVPLIVVATAQDKLNGAGTATASGTTKANAGKALKMTSQKDLLDTFGIPFFEKTASSTPIHGSERNEYGLLAAYSLLGVSNAAFIVRADVDLSQLEGQAVAPGANPNNGQWWIDTQSTAWGIFEWNGAAVSTTGGQKFAAKTPIVLTNSDSTKLTNGQPKASVGAIGDYAIVFETVGTGSGYSASKELATLWFKSAGNTTAGVSVGQWVQVGSNDWKVGLATVVSNTISGTISSTNSGNFLLNGTVVSIESGLDAVDIADEINNLSIQGVTAKALSGQVYLYADSTAASNGSTEDGNIKIEATSATTVNAGSFVIGTAYKIKTLGDTDFTLIGASANTVGVEFTATGAGTGTGTADTDPAVLSGLGLASGTYYGPALAMAPHTQVPQWKDSGTGQTNRPTGSVWVKTTEPGGGARWRAKKFDSATTSWVSVDAPIYATPNAALYYLDRSGGGANLKVDQLFVQSNATEASVAADTSNPELASFRVWRRANSGATMITSSIITGLAAVTNTFTIAESLKGQIALDAAKTISFTASNDSTDADLIAAEINAAGFTNIVASVTVDNRLEIAHKLGGDFRITETASTPISGIFTLFDLDTSTGTSNFYADPTGTTDQYLVSNWQPLAALDFSASNAAPKNEPADGQLWYNPEFSQVDIMVHDGDTWVGYLNQYPATNPEGPFVSASAPTAQSDSTDLENNDLWISTASTEDFPTIYRYSNKGTSTEGWVLVDKTDQITEDGVLFADARWRDESMNTSAPSGAGEADSIIDLLTSDFLDFDAPDPALYPRGMLLWNLRRSGGNVKKYHNSYVDQAADNVRMNGAAMTNYATDRWVTASANNEDGSGSFGRKAQRSVVVAALKSVTDTSQEIRDEERRNFNLIAAPGYPELLSNLVNLNIDRGITAFVVGDSPMRLASDATTLTNWGTNADLVTDNGDNGLVTYDEYAAVFYPSGFTTDLSGSNAVVPSSHMMLKTIALSDNASYPWFAPAGTRRGGITNATAVGYIDALSGEFQTVALNEGQRDTLYDLKVNPITFFNGVGLVNYGQKTRARNASALDRINVARLVVYLRSQLNKLARPYIFEPNDKITRDEVKQAVESLLLELVGLRALYDFAVVCDDSNNTPTRIDRNELWVDIAIEPVKAVEFIYIPLRVKNTGEI